MVGALLVAAELPGETRQAGGDVEGGARELCAQVAQLFPHHRRDVRRLLGPLTFLKLASAGVGNVQTSGIRSVNQSRAA